jgi:hypothetical protein
MPTEGVKTLRFAARISSIQYSTIVGLVTAGGVIRAEYISGSEDKISGDWVYNFLILEEDIPSGLTFDAITGSIFVAPYVQVWSEGTACDEYCYPLTATETITELPDYVVGLDVQGALVEGVTQVCEVKITMAEFATLITQILDLDFLATYICEICECGNGAAIEVQDDAVSVVAAASILNFTGAGVTVTDAGGGQADIDIPGGGGGAGTASYAGIRALDNASSTAIAAATWGIVTECWDANTAYADSTPTFATGLITVGTTGDYEIDVDLTINGTDLNTYYFEVYLEGVATGYKGAATVGDLSRNAVTIGGIISLVAGEELSLWVTSDGGIDAVTVTQGQFCMHYLGETIGG